MPTSTSNDVTIALAEQRIAVLEEKVAKLSADRDQALKWGLMSLGGALLGLVGWIASYVQSHMK